MHEENLGGMFGAVPRKIVMVPPMSRTTEMKNLVQLPQITRPDRTKNLPRNAPPGDCSSFGGRREEPRAKRRILYLRNTQSRFEEIVVRASEGSSA